MESQPIPLTEKQKMLKGEYYNAFEETLLQDRKRAKQLCQQLNDLSDASQAERSQLFKQFLNIVLPGVRIGNNTVIGTGSIVTKNIPDNVVALGNPCRVIREIK